MLNCVEYCIERVDAFNYSLKQSFGKAQNHWGCVKLMVLYFFKNLSIRNKFLIFFYTLIIIISLFSGYYSYALSERYVIGRVSSVGLGSMNQLTGSLSVIQSDMYDVSTQICLNPDLQELLLDLSRNSTTVTTISENFNFLSSMLVSKRYISYLAVYGTEGHPLYYHFKDSSFDPNPIEEIKNSDLYRRVKDAKGAPVWFRMEVGSNEFVRSNNSPKISLCRLITDINSGARETGLLVITLNEAYFKKLYATNLQSRLENLLITDQEGNSFCQWGSNAGILKEYLSTDLEDTSSGFRITGNKKDSLLITYGTVAESGWKVISSIPMQIVRSEINSGKTMIMFTTLACIVIFFPLSLLISSILTAPIKRLLKSMKRFEKGDFSQQVTIHNQDEIGQLGQGYNNMVTSIKELFEKFYMLQIKEKEAELNVLQAQINPHFLYNTLDSIFWKAKRHGDSEVSSMVYSLSRLFRLSLNRGKSFTLVADEKELLENYLKLIKIRYKERLTYFIDIDEEIMKYPLPKLLLQPFVENSIAHGIELKDQGGCVSIRGFRYEGQLVFEIRDDGVGMTPEQLKNLKDSLKSDSPVVPDPLKTGEYAIKNVFERLSIYYKNQFEFCIESSKELGTSIRLVIPAVQQMEGVTTNYV